jgi:TctA family transporter
MIDVIIMLAFEVIGYLLKRFRFPQPPDNGLGSWQDG